MQDSKKEVKFSYHCQRDYERIWTDKTNHLRLQDIFKSDIDRRKFQFTFRYNKSILTCPVVAMKNLLFRYMFQ